MPSGPKNSRGPASPSDENTEPGAASEATRNQAEDVDTLVSGFLRELSNLSNEIPVTRDEADQTATVAQKTPSPQGEEQPIPAQVGNKDQVFLNEASDASPADYDFEIAEILSELEKKEPETATSVQAETRRDSLVLETSEPVVPTVSPIPVMPHGAFEPGTFRAQLFPPEAPPVTHRQVKIAKERLSGRLPGPRRVLAGRRTLFAGSAVALIIIGLAGVHFIKVSRQSQVPEATRIPASSPRASSIPIPPTTPAEHASISPPAVRNQPTKQEIASTPTMKSASRTNVGAASPPPSSGAERNPAAGSYASGVEAAARGQSPPRPAGNAPEVEVPAQAKTPPEQAQPAQTVAASPASAAPAGVKEVPVNISVNAAPASEGKPAKAKTPQVSPPAAPSPKAPSGAEDRATPTQDLARTAPAAAGTETTTPPKKKEAAATEPKSPTIAVPVHRVVPNYPQMARNMRIAGKVELDVEVDESGKVVRATAVNGPLVLRPAAEEALRSWQFRPATRNGINARSVVRIAVVFSP